MGTRLHPLKDALRITPATRRSLKKQMKRWLRRRNKGPSEEALKNVRHKGWWW